MQTFRLQIPSFAMLRLSAAALFAACLLGSPAGAQAPSPVAPPSSAGPGQSDQSTAIPEQKLDAAALALQKVVDLKRDYERRIDAASGSDKQGIVDEAKGALTKAVTDQGLSVEEYTAIIVMAQRDPVVREQILRRLPQAEGSSPRN